MSKDDGDVDFSALGEKLERLSRLNRQQGFQAGLNPVQWEALRYVARANRFSNSPGALTLYLGSTKGTVSQSLMSLLKKGLIHKTIGTKDARSMALSLTDAGQALMAHDPALLLEADLRKLGGKTLKRFAKGVSEVLNETIMRHSASTFGTCLTCRHWRDRSGGDKNSTCMLFNAALEASETNRLCQHYLVR